MLTFASRLVVFLALLFVFACDSGVDGAGAVQGVWEDPDSNGLQYFVVEEATFSFYSGSINMDCFPVATHELRKTGPSEYEILMRKVVFLGRDPLEITMAFEYVSGSDMLMFRDHTGEANFTARRSDKSVGDLMPVCEAL